MAGTVAQEPERDTSAWVAWAAFAGMLAILTGVFHAISGLVALLTPTFYLVGDDGFVLALGWKGWGVLHLVVGAGLVALGVGIVAGRAWARWSGVALVGVSAVQNMLFVPAYPVWATIMLALDVLILWALVVHGGALRAYR